MPLGYYNRALRWRGWVAAGEVGLEVSNKWRGRVIDLTRDRLTAAA
jgi:hypothetical protein